MKEDHIPLDIDGNQFLKRPFGRYISSGGIGEKVFEEYCKQNNIYFVKALFLMWAVYFDYLKKIYGKLTKTNENKSKKWNCKKTLSFLSEKQY